MSSRNLSIKGKRKGERVAFSDCNIEPLNLLIPGGGPILVPKKKAWPGQRKKTTVTVEIPLDDNEGYYDAEEEEDELEERPAAAVKSRKVSQAAKVNSEQKKKKGKIACKVDLEKSTKAVGEERDRRKLVRRIREQEEYIAQLKAKYERRNTRVKSPEETDSDSDSDPDFEADVDSGTDEITADEDDDAAQTSEDASSDAGAADDDTASEKVRKMLKAVRIKAAGTDDEGFTLSEDAQILARKEAGESFKMIAGFMKRPRKQISRRYEELVKAGKTAETAGTDGPGEGDTADETKAGETIDAETTDAKNNNAAEVDAQVAEGDFGGLFDLGDLTDALETVVEEQAKTEKKASPAKKNDKFTNKGKNQQKKNSPSPKPKGDIKKTPPKTTTTGEESGYDGGSEVVPDDAGTRLYINQYARHLLRNQDRIPEVDDKFDENDCIMLALAESHLKYGKWEEIQARFANATGRMVPIEVLKYKLGGGGKPDYY